MTLVSIELIDDLSGTISAPGFSRSVALARENQLEREVLGWADIGSFTVALDGSGAIDNVVFEGQPVPLPGAFPLLAGSMGAIAVARARRKR